MSGEDALMKEGVGRHTQAGTPDQRVELIPLRLIDPNYLVRDRLIQDDDEMASLKVSLKARGQHVPIEVTKLPSGHFGYGLISGWRRYMALRELHAETQDPQFGVVRSLLITPETAQDAYLAMVEENEIRVNLSFYERARIALRAVHEGVFPDTRTSLRRLYGSSTRSKRSKIGTFVSLVDHFDGVLQHPTAISEKLGLALARELMRDPGFAQRVTQQLRNAAMRTAFEETRLLAHMLGQHHAPDPPVPAEPSTRSPRHQEVRHAAVGRLQLQFRPEASSIRLSGSDIDEAFFEDLMRWIEERRQ